MVVKESMPAGPILVAGLGRAGEAALSVVCGARNNRVVAAWDSRDNANLRAKAARWRRRGVVVTLGRDGRDVLGQLGPATTIIKSPGIDMDFPLLERARKLGVEILDELEIGWRAYPGSIVAVTGTNGKSTTCALIACILSASGRHPQIVGNTEFGPPLSGADPTASAVCEVSSFQLQASPTFLPNVAVFTNLTPEHLPRHGTMKAYGDAKQSMFVRASRTCGIAVVNADDERGRRIIADVKAANGHVISYGFSPDADVRILEAHWTMRDAVTVIEAKGTVTQLQSRLPGRHNALNIAASFGVGQAANLAQKTVVAGIQATVAPPGRFEQVDLGQSFDVVVDYAHTPDGITQFLDALRSVTSARNTALRTVFGAVGLSDPPKARGCAEAAATLSDQLILTTGSAPGSPRILRLRELYDAARSARRVELVLDRRCAIQHAISAAQPGDVVAILGLGALNRLVLDAAGSTCPFDDREAARQAIRLRAQCQ
jgi:UDP-N-acetylmuramoyl-L-alanyl-D-glutamate--2,6-diaminopimelate ligase